MDGVMSEKCNVDSFGNDTLYTVIVMDEVLSKKAVEDKP